MSPLVLFFAALLLIPLMPSPGRALPLDDRSGLGEALTRVYRQIQPSIVQVIAYRPIGPSPAASEGTPGFSRLEPPRRTYWASGIVVNSRGYVLTCAGAAQPGDSLEVRKADGSRFGATFLAQDPTFGISLLQVRGATGLTPLSPGPDSATRCGDWLLVLGFAPGAGEPQLKLATMAGVEPGPGGHAAYLRMNLADCRGTCGAAVVDGAGTFRGMVVDINVDEERTVSYNRTDPADVLDCDAAWALRCVKLDSLSSRLLALSHEPVGFLGVRAQVGDDMPRAEVNAMADPTGVLRVVRVIPGSPAEQAGIQADDQILEINGHAVTSPAEIMALVASARPGTFLQIKVLRRGVPLVLAPRVGDRSSLEWLDREDRMNALRRKRIAHWIQQLQEHLQRLDQQRSALE
jgi:S1-C subfamily serine protease